MPATMIETSHRTEATRVLLSAWDRRLAEWDEVETSTLLNGRMVEDLVSDVKRARREFDAKLFFVSVFGPLKAGKSTLVNCLARSNVSPTKLGRECTMRPSIVIRADEPGIDVYVRKHSAATDDRRAFHVVIDHLRGLVEEEELEKLVSRRRLPLSPETVERQLSGKDLDQDPLITVIRVPGGGFLQDSVALLDLPGLDGRLAGWAASPVQEWITSRSDFLIYVQSSISALSHDGFDFLKQVIQGRKSPPLWLVQNVMDAKHWRSREERDEETALQQEAARHEIERVVLKKLSSTAINLGKADDGIRHPHHADKLPESSFERFESQLLRTLQEERELIHERNSVSDASASFERGGKLLAAYRAQANEVLSAHRRVLQQVEESMDRIKDIEYRRDANGEQRVEEAIAELEKRWKTDFGLLVEDAQRRADRRISGSEIDALLADVARRGGRAGADLFDLDGPIGGKVKQWAASSIEYSETGILSFLEEGLVECGMAPFPEPTGWSSKDGWRIDDGPLEAGPPESDRGWRKLKKLGQKLGETFGYCHESAKAREMIRQATRGLEPIITNHAKAFQERNKLLAYFDRRRAQLRQHLSDELRKYMLRMEPQVERAERALDLAQRLVDEIEAMKSLAQEADWSMSHVTQKEDGDGTDERL